MQLRLYHKDFAPFCPPMFSCNPEIIMKDETEIPSLRPPWHLLSFVMPKDLPQF